MKKKKNRESALLPATAEMLTVSMCLCVFAVTPASPHTPTSLFSGRVPLLLPLAKQTIKNMHSSGRDSTRCKHFKRPIAVLPPRLPSSVPPLIGHCGCTDVPPLMIFVTIKLIVVYGSEMQECGGTAGTGGRGEG